MDQLVASGSCVLRKVGGDRAGEMACHRFLSSSHSSVAAILSGLAARTAAACAGRHVVCIQDTSEINFKNREANRRGFGCGADGTSPAFFLHPLLAVDTEEEAVLGLVGAEIWTRPPVKVGPRGVGDKGREATVELRARRVRIVRPSRLSKAQAAAAVAMTVVEAREPHPPAGKTALHWRLLSSADITPARAVQLYRLRWRIEQLFRTCKSDGLRFDETQMHDAGRLMKFAAMALGAAARIMQLVDARDGSRRPASDALDAGFLPALEAISKTLEGKTARQKKPHPPDSLAFLAWVCARLGGWNCYYKPPGPKTMRSGWETLAAQLTGFTLATGLGKA